MTKNIYCQHLNCNTKLLPSQPKFCSLSCSTKEKNRLSTIKKIAAYNLEPNYCIQCNKSLDYIHRGNKFCSHSCSAIKNNTGTKRGPSKSNNKSICQECSLAFKNKSNSRGKFCSVACCELAQKKRFKQQFEQGILSERSSIKKYIVERDTYKCSECSIKDWQGKPISLHLDHIDGNPGNNLPNNFRLLCPNCHSQTLSYGSKNKGFGRKARGLPTR